MDFMGKMDRFAEYQLLVILTDKSYTVYSACCDQEHFLGVEEKKTEDTEADEL
jgi:hypothetical protein